MNLAKFLRTPFLQNTSGRLLLDIYEKYFVFLLFCIRIKEVVKKQIQKAQFQDGLKKSCYETVSLQLNLKLLPPSHFSSVNFQNLF